MSICIGCTNVNFFGPNLCLLKPSDEQMAALRASDAWPEIVLVKTAITLARARGTGS